MTIYDIAHQAGVSIATVSRVVNNSPTVSEKTRAQVLKVMEETGYTPNAFARALGSHSMQTIGLVCPDISDAYMAKAVSFLESSLRGYGYDCMLYCSGYDLPGCKTAVSAILQKGVDALVMIGSVYSEQGSAGRGTAYIRQAAQKLPVFMVNAYVKADNVYCALCNDFQASYDAVQHLLRTRRSKILYLSDSHSFSATQKQLGYKAALRDAGIRPDARRILRIDNRITQVRDLLLGLPRADFDAVFATDDGLAIGALKYARARGLRVPQDLSVIGYNNFELSLACEPELTTVDSRVEELCRRLIDTMMGLFQKQPVEQTIYVEGRVIPRATTLPLP